MADRIQSPVSLYIKLGEWAHGKAWVEALFRSLPLAVLYLPPASRALTSYFNLTRQ